MVQRPNLFIADLTDRIQVFDRDGKFLRGWRTPDFNVDGPSGLTILNSDERIDLLLTDVGLPGGLNGRQVADIARATRPGLRVLFVTGYAENAAVGAGYLEPGMQVVTKPFAMTTLAARVREIIQS